MNNRKHHLDCRAKVLVAQASGHQLDQLLSTRELAEWLGVSRQWLEIGRSRGYGPEFIRIAPRRIRYSRKAVIAWLDARSHRATAEYMSKETDGVNGIRNRKDV